MLTPELEKKIRRFNEIKLNKDHTVEADELWGEIGSIDVVVMLLAEIDKLRVKTGYFKGVQVSVFTESGKLVMTLMMASHQAKTYFRPTHPLNFTLGTIELDRY